MLKGRALKLAVSIITTAGSLTGLSILSAGPGLPATGGQARASAVRLARPAVRHRAARRLRGLVTTLAERLAASARSG